MSEHDEPSDHALAHRVGTRERTETDLFASRGVRATDPETSREAALAHLAGRATDRRAAFDVHLSHAQGLTDFELAAAMGRQQTSAGKRRGELRDLGIVADSGRRRPSPSGTRAIVWTITEFGVSLAATLKADR